MTPPFPFNQRQSTADDKLFGERKQGFHFEHIASEFENSYEEADSGIESEACSSTLSPGSSLFSPLSVSSLTSPSLPSPSLNASSRSSTFSCDVVGDQTKPLCLVKKETESPVSTPVTPVTNSKLQAKHWKKSLTRNFLSTKTSDTILSPKKVNVLRDISNILPQSQRVFTPEARHKIVQPWNIASKPSSSPRHHPYQIPSRFQVNTIASRIPEPHQVSPPVAQRIKTEQIGLLPTVQIKSEPARIPVLSIPEPKFTSLPPLYPIHEHPPSSSYPMYLMSSASPASGQHAPHHHLNLSFPTSPLPVSSPHHLNTSADFYSNSIFSSAGSLSPCSSTSVGQISGEHQQQAAPMYYCKECKKSFCTESGYIKHQHLHSSNQIQKQFSCKYCQKTYNSQSALKMHIRTHTLPCKCPECGKSFSRPWLLQGHMRTHTGEKPFSCTHCTRNFADKSNLRAHLQTHLQNKKYSCPSCRKSFSRMSLLTKHTESGCNCSTSRPTVTQPLMDVTNLIS